MIKPNSLRAALAAIFPEFDIDPNRLHLWVEEGHVRCHAADPAVGEDLSFSIEYTLKVWIEKWDKPSIAVWIVLLDWLRVQQPDLLTPAQSKTAIPFEADLLSETEADLGFDLTLTEPVKAIRREDGGFDMQVIAEPEHVMPDTFNPPLPGEVRGETLKSIWIDGEKLAGVE